MSFLHFSILEISTNFCPIKIELSSNTVLGNFDQFLSTQNVNVARNFQWDFFLWFSNTVFFGGKCKAKIVFFLWFLSTMWKCFDLGKIECLLRFASIVSMPDDWKVRVVFWEILLSAGFSPLIYFFSHFLPFLFILPCRIFAQIIYFMTEKKVEMHKNVRNSAF